METQPSARSVTNLLLSRCCPPQLLFGLGVLLLQLGRLLLQLMLVLQPPHLLVLQQPGEETKELVDLHFFQLCVSNTDQRRHLSASCRLFSACAWLVRSSSRTLSTVSLSRLLVSIRSLSEWDSLPSWTACSLFCCHT